MNLYVGNLPYSVRDAELRETFEAFGDVVSAEVIIDKRTRKSRGYGFVRMGSDDEGQAAIDNLDGSDLQGRALRVDQSKPKEKNGHNGQDARRSNGQGNNGNQDRSNHHSAAPPNESGGVFGFVKRLFG